MFFLLFSSFSLASDVNLCFFGASGSGKCPAGYTQVESGKFDKWTESVTDRVDTINMKFVDSVPSGKMISPNAISFFASKLVITGDSASVLVVLDTSQNFVMVEELTIETVSVQITTNVLSCDKVTLKGTKLTSQKEGTISCDSLELNGDLMSVVVFNNEIMATKCNFDFSYFAHTTSYDLTFTSQVATSININNPDCDMSWTSLPGVLLMKFDNVSQYIKFNINNVHPKFIVSHTVQNVKLTLVEIAASGVSLLRSMSFTTDSNTFIAFPHSLASSNAKVTIANTGSNNLTIVQDGETLPTDLKVGSNLVYQIGENAKTIGSIGLGESINVLGSNENQQEVRINSFSSSTGDKFHASKEHLTINLPAVEIDRPMQFQGKSKYHFDSLNIKQALSVSNLVIDDNSTLNIIPSKDYVPIQASSIQSTNATININLDNSIQVGEYNLIKASDIDCSSIKFSLNSIEGNEYHLPKAKATLTCSKSEVKITVATRENPLNSQFCIGVGMCPEDFYQISTQEEFDNWTTIVPQGSKSIQFTILNDIGTPSEPLVFDFSSFSKGIKVTYRSVGLQKNRPLQITEESFGGIIDTIVTNVQLGIKGNSTKKIALPNLVLQKVNLDPAFQARLDSQYQDHYTIDMTLETSLTNIYAAHTDITLPSSSATILFQDNNWQITLNDVQIYPILIDYVKQHVMIHSAPGSSSQFTLQCQSTGNIAPIYIDASQPNSVFNIEGKWPESFTGIHFVNPAISHYVINSQPSPVTFDSLETNSPIDIESSKALINMTKPIKASNGINFGKETKISQLELTNGGAVRSVNNLPIAIDELTIHEEAQITIQHNTNINSLFLNKLSTTTFSSVSSNESFPSYIEFHYSLPSMPFIQVDKISKSNVQLNFSYLKGTEDILTAEQEQIISKYPIKVVCGQQVSCKSWTSVFSAENNFTATCKDYNNQTCYELNYIPKSNIDEGLSTLEIIIIVCFSLIAIGLIIACVIFFIKNSKSSKDIHDSHALLKEQDDLQ